MARAGIDIKFSSHQEIAIYTNQTTQDSCEPSPLSLKWKR